MQYGLRLCPGCGKGYYISHAHVCGEIEPPEARAEIEALDKVVGTEVDQIVAAAKGTKFDTGKPDLTLLPRSFKEGVAQALMYGAKKYGRANFKQGLEVTRVLAGIDRHLTAFNDGENMDPESGLSHLSHAGAGIAMLIELLHINKAIDDRG